MPDSCITDPSRECIGIKRAEEVAGELKALDRKMEEFQQRVNDTSGRFGARIGTLETKQEVREEQFKQFKERLNDLTRDIAESQRENKESLSAFRQEHKESLSELRKDTKSILDALNPLKHRVEALEHVAQDVEELKSKPAETWEHIKKQGLGWTVVLILAILAVALGLGKYL